MELAKNIDEHAALCSKTQFDTNTFVYNLLVQQKNRWFLY